jgi:endonuclease YncB( thermonuclease family)
MKWLGILILSASPALADQYEITRVIDGDTVEIAVDFLPAPLPPKLSIRVIGIDTPEKAPRAQCEAEAALAKKASAFTKNAVANATETEVYILKWDKYGGRVLGSVVFDGVSLSDSLIAAGLARPYKGDAKQSWCEE